MEESGATNDDNAGSGPASVLWMNAAFLLEELHQDADFRAMTAVVGTPDPPASPALSIESIDAFLNEIGQLSGDDDFHSTDADRSQDQTTRMRIASPVSTTEKGRVEAAHGIAGTTDSPKPKKKKTRKKTVSSLERVRREKAVLRHDIDQMEQATRLLQRQQYDKIAGIFTKRWKHRYLYEIHQRKRLEAEQLRLQERMGVEHHRSGAVFELIRASLQVRYIFHDSLLLL